MSTSCHGITSLLSGNRDSSTVVYKSDGRGRVFSNTQLAPFRHQCMLVAGLSKQTMALQDDELHFAHIRLQSCRHSYIYIMAPVRYIIYLYDKCAYFLDRIVYVLVVKL